MSKKIKFEEAFNRLEEIARRLEEGDISLEESLELYEEGMKLINLCNQKLEAAGKKILTLSKAADGTFQTRPLDTLNDSE
jgi:exodeoxyribonuclease VII small subunit